MNDNELLAKGFKLSLSRKQLVALDEANEGAVQLALASNTIVTKFHKVKLAYNGMLHSIQLNSSNRNHNMIYHTMNDSNFNFTP